MRKKLIALIGAGVLLAGCASTVDPEPSTEEAAPLEFCDELDTRNNDYDGAMTSTATVMVKTLVSFGPWADRLLESAPDDIKDDVVAYLSPIREAEEAPDGFTMDKLDAIEWSSGHNAVNIYCVSNG